MPKVQEIIGFIQRRKGQYGDFNRRIGKTPKVDGGCQSIILAIDQFDGQHWFSPQAFGIEDQKYPGHAVGVIPVSKTSETALVVDFSSKDGPVIGQVSNFSDKKKTSMELEEITGCSGWELRRRVKV